MAFTVDDFHDLVRLLEAHPDWKQDLRRLVLTDELLSLPGIVRDLAAAQQETVARLTELAAAQQRTEEQLAALTARVDELAAAQQRTEGRLGRLVGDVLEERFRHRAATWLGRVGLRRVRLIPDSEWVDAPDDAVDTGRLTPADREALLLTDARARARDADGEVWVAVEVSATIDRHDVERARERAVIPARWHGRARGAVAGQAFTVGAEAALAADPALIKVPLPVHDD